MQAKILNIAREQEYSAQDTATGVKVIMKAALPHVNELVAIDTKRNMQATERVVGHINSLSDERKKGLRLFAEDYAHKQYGDNVTDNHIEEAVVELLQVNGAVHLEDILAEHSLQEEVILRDAITRFPSDAQLVAGIVLDAMYPQSRL